MKFLERLGLAIFSIIVLTLSIALLLIGFSIIEPTIFSILLVKVISSQQYTYILIGVCIVLILLSIRCLFFSNTSKEEEDESGIQLQNDDGKLLITKNTLVNLVEGVVSEIPNVDTADTSVIIDRDNNVSINVVIDVMQGVIIKDVSSKLQTKIKKTVKDATDLELKSVNIEVRNVQIEQEADSEEE